MYQRQIQYHRSYSERIEVLTSQNKNQPCLFSYFGAYKVSPFYYGPTVSSKVAVDDDISTHSCPELCLDMKHKRKKSKRDLIHKSNKKKLHKKVHKTKSNEPKEKYFNFRLKHLAMASGFQGTSTSLVCPAADDDDIVVVYDKLQETNQNRECTRKQEENKFCLTKQQEVNLEDIPLPPATWVTPFRKLNNAIKLAEIPLPPCPSNHEKLRTSSLSEIELDAKQQKKFLKEFRKWEHTELGETMQNKGCFESNSFTVMSYNVLAQQLLENHHYLYRKHDSRALQWKFRSAILLKEIQEANADILCLQEVQANHLDSFYSKLDDLGYKGLFKQRANGNVDGCAIYYKSDKFNLVDSTTVEYFQNYFSSFCVLDRYNIAIIARLALKDSVGFSNLENQVVVATTHLLYNPRRHDVKLAQSQVLLAELDRMSYIGADTKTGRPKYCPTIVTGDFNLEPDTAVYRLLVEGQLHYSDLTAKSLTFASHGQRRQEALLPFELQISNQCQHIGLLLHRLKQGNTWSRNEHLNTLNFTKLYHSEHYKSPQQYWHIQSGVPLLYEEDFYGRTERGCLRHFLNLQSVYKHERQSPTSKRMTREATTHQDDWVTVDYIFYSGDWNEQGQHAEEGRLKLLSRYILPTCGQCHELKSIPNLVCGSDHLCLMARFILNME